MKKKLRTLYLSIEINLILWLVVFGGYWPNSLRPESTTEVSQISGNIVKFGILIGFLFAAIVQHWAFYNVRKELTTKDA